MKNFILATVLLLIIFESYSQTSQNPLYLNYNSTLSSATYISSSGSHGNQPSMFFHLPYVGTTGNAIFEWDADDSGNRNAIYQFKASGDRIFELKGWNDGSNSEFWFGDDNNDKFYISDAGNIGIGLLNPQNKLHIKDGSIGITKIRTGTNSELPLIVGSQHVYEPQDRGFAGIYHMEDGSGGYGQAAGLIFKTSENDAAPQTRMTIRANGSIGIGTINTFGYKLAVNGTIGSTEVKVENTSAWPDFVFEDNFELRTLEEVEEYINEKGHLPEIPSEAEVTENGINLGEMNAKLLQKIEELTLYLIEQNKKIEKLQNEVSALKTE